ncbi:MAG: hypothetical protein ACFCU6_03795 [Balneolaceae bacterium]
MQIFGNLILILCFLFIHACSTPSPVSEGNDAPESRAEPDPVSEADVIPPWYIQDQHGLIENDTIYSFGMATDTDENIALKLAEKQCGVYLKYQIDKLLEQARMELVDQQVNEAGSPEFIRNLRNKIQNIQFDAVITDHDTIKNDQDIVAAYFRQSVSKQHAKQILRSLFEDDQHLNMLLDTRVFN